MVKVCIKISQNWVINRTKANRSLKPNKIVHDSIWPFCPQNLGSTEGFQEVKVTLKLVCTVSLQEN